MGDDEPVVGYSMTGVPITEPKRRMPRLRWWMWALIVLAGVMLIGSLTHTSSSSTDPVVSRNYPQWLHECQDRATEDVHASDGLYVVGGNHWVGLVNDCLMTKANDQP